MFDIMKIQSILPHRYPFLLVDKISLLNESKYIEGYKNISISDPVFQGHFPDYPIYPGVLIIEGMAQIGGVLISEKLRLQDGEDSLKNKIIYFMSIDKAKFRAPVFPGDKLVYKIELLQQRNLICSFKAKAFVDEKLVSEAELKAMLTNK